MKIGLFQYSPTWEDIATNKSKVSEIISKHNQKFDLIIFPEMTLTGFTMNSKTFAEGLDGECTKFFLQLSHKLKTNIIAGIIESDNGKIFNSAVHFFDRLVMARYHKIHPFSLAGENKFYSDSKETVITKIDITKIGLSVCYDLRFPELYRKYGKERVEMMINIANWPIPRIEHWKTLLKARAIENLCYMIGVNRTGSDPNVHYNGCSSVFSPSGEELLCVENEEGLFEIEIDIEAVAQARNKFNFLEDIRLI